MRDQRTRLKTRVAECRGCGCVIERRGHSRFGWCDSCDFLKVELISLDGDARILRGDAVADPLARPQLLIEVADEMAAAAAEIRLQLRERSGPVWAYVSAYQRAVEDIVRAKTGETTTEQADVVSIASLRRARS